MLYVLKPVHLKGREPAESKRQAGVRVSVIWLLPRLWRKVAEMRGGTGAQSPSGSDLFSPL